MVGATWHVRGSREIHGGRRVLWGKLKEQDHMENIGVDARVILNDV
jgi:hypothetical protein